MLRDVRQRSIYLASEMALGWGGLQFTEIVSASNQRFAKWRIAFQGANRIYNREFSSHARPFYGSLRMATLASAALCRNYGRHALGADSGGCWRTEVRQECGWTLKMSRRLADE